MVPSDPLHQHQPPLEPAMAGPDNLEPVPASWQPGDAKDIPVKASPPREKSPTVSEVKEGAAGGDGEGGAMPSSSSVTPPDGGWGWAVVFASFMIHIIGRLARLWCSLYWPIIAAHSLY